MSGRYFGTDGIRGRANKFPMNAEIAMRVGMAAGLSFQRGSHRHRVVLGKDTRLSGYMIENAMVAGLCAAGMDVFLLGPIPTPAVAMLVRSLRADIGVMISASHNPYYDNGIKLFGPDGFKLNDDVELEIEGLIDGDMRRGTLHQVFNVARDPGLSNLLIGAGTPELCIRSVGVGTGTLDILPCGVLPPNPSELFGSKRLTELLKFCEEKYEMVIFDSPPVNLVTDAAVLGAKAGGVILIGRAGRTDKGALAYAAEQLRNVRAPLIGTVLNDFDFRRDVRYSSYGTAGYYYYSSYGYGYREGYGAAYGEDPSAARNGNKAKAKSTARRG